MAETPQKADGLKRPGGDYRRYAPSTPILPGPSST